MKRRNALRAVSVILGGTLISSELFLSSCTDNSSKAGYHDFDANQLDMISQITETILPETSSPGAIEAGVADFFPMMLEDCYSSAQNEAVVNGLIEIDKSSRNKYKKSFLHLSASEKHEIIKDIDVVAYTPENSGHFFRIFKEITLLGYFTSEVGLTQAQNYVLIPGKYDGAAKYDEGDKNTIFAMGR